MNRGQILIVPAVEKGKGGGHLYRCATLVRDLRASGREARLYLSVQTEETDRLLKTTNFNPSWRITDEELANGDMQIEFVILDRFQTPREELLRWKKTAPVIGIDEGGTDRNNFDFLIDILIPEKLISPKANISSPSLLKFPPLPLSKKISTDGVLKVLITFGQEDAAGLGQKTARALSAMDGMEITLLMGALAKGKIEQLPNVRVLESIPNLAEHLGEYDLVITHYGITAYEALYAGTPVLLDSPTKYHAKLAKTAGFYTVKKINHGVARSYTELHGELKEHCEGLAVKYKLREGEKLASLLCGFAPKVNRVCPVCGANAPERSVARFADRTYRRCQTCGLIFMDRISPAPIVYEREYFFESYKKQYGKTYLEDFDSIKTVGKRRAKLINSFLPDGAERALLDIGCAYGPFLAAAKEEGFSPSGIDPAQDAVSYVQKELKFPAVCGFFPDCPLPSESQFDAVTLWFVIEHLTNCSSVLVAIKKILKTGGILAFSTPSFSGVSGRANLQRFLSASPADHFTVWSPEMCRKALLQSGFKVKKIVSIGHHPERFALLGRFAKSKKSPLYFLLLAISKLFSLGDTFEVYAQVY
jgi:2-polyprenyl-3-methyl-5-hydroxy-6-metoxy-1,4-benzoquinol methylase/spore coat polysaccharide biosynthesis predicted glycosyltransferase SpsG